MRSNAAQVLHDIRPAADLDSFELLIGAILAEASNLNRAQRSELAERVLALGGYVSAEGSPRDADRARLAVRLAARLSAAP